MSTIEANSTFGAGQRGFALVLSLLVLTLVTFLGLTLALSSSTEVQIATNYRWSQQALYNAEAGLEVARQALQTIEWRDAVLPPRRTRSEMKWTPQKGVPTNVYGSRAGANGEPSRDFEQAECDKSIDQGQAFIGRGIVFDSPSFEAPLQNLSTFAGQTLNGTFTVWVRRPLIWSAAEKTWVDDAEDDSVVVTAEGTAPYMGAAAITDVAHARGAARYLQVTLVRSEDCDAPPSEVGPGGAGSCSAAPESGGTEP
jgi:PilX N-terminal